MRIENWRDTPRGQALEREYDHFRSIKDNLRAREQGRLLGRALVFRNGQMIGDYSSYDDAVRSAAEQFPDRLFLVQVLLPESQELQTPITTP